eukprot:969011-Amphidinium_carterae.1
MARREDPSGTGCQERWSKQSNEAKLLPGFPSIPAVSAWPSPAQVQDPCDRLNANTNIWRRQTRWIARVHFW